MPRRPDLPDVRRTPFGTGRTLVAALAAALVLGAGPADDGRTPGSGSAADSGPIAPGLAGSQVTLETQRVEFQGTIIGRLEAPPRLVVATAAHGLFPLGEGTPIALRAMVGGGVLRGTVVAATPNPSYKPVRARDPRAAARFQGAIGSDNAVLTIAVVVNGPPDRAVFEELRVAAVAERPIPARVGVATLTVRVVDRLGVEHTVRGSTSMNPKWLAWGRSYHPRPGDSGAGVFVLAGAPDGPRTPLLIGNVVASDEGGGIAALFSASEFPALKAVAEAAAPR